MKFLEAILLIISRQFSSISKDNLKQPQVASYRREGEGGGTACVRLFPDSLGKKERLDR